MSSKHTILDHQHIWSWWFIAFSFLKWYLLALVGVKSLTCQKGSLFSCKYLLKCFLRSLASLFLGRTLEEGCLILVTTYHPNKNNTHHITQHWAGVCKVADVQEIHVVLKQACDFSFWLKIRHFNCLVKVSNVILAEQTHDRWNGICWA